MNLKKSGLLYFFIHPVMFNIMPDNTHTLLFGGVIKDTFGLNIKIKTGTLLTYYTFRVKDSLNDKLRAKDITFAL